MTAAASPPALDLRAFDARFRWVVLPEMRRLQEPLGLLTVDDLDRVYRFIRTRTIAALQAANRDPLLAASIDVRVAASQAVDAILEAAESPDPPESADAVAEPKS
jgi:hypothetical protein